MNWLWLTLGWNATLWTDLDLLCLYTDTDFFVLVSHCWTLDVDPLRSTFGSIKLHANVYGARLHLKSQTFRDIPALLRSHIMIVPFVAADAIVFWSSGFHFTSVHERFRFFLTPFLKLQKEINSRSRLSWRTLKLSRPACRDEKWVTTTIQIVIFVNEWWMHLLLQLEFDRVRCQ